jgi:hypothetical protein
MKHTINVCYLAGPMAGYPDHNHPAFHEAAAALRACGHVVINPAEYGNLIMLGWQGAMKRDLHAMLWCDALVMLPGWEKSRSARLETRTAWDLEMPIFPLDVMICDCIRPGEDEPIWHTDSCIDQRIPIEKQVQCRSGGATADDLTTVAMYSRAYADGDIHAAADRVLQALGKSDHAVTDAQSNAMRKTIKLSPDVLPTAQADGGWPDWVPRDRWGM